MNRKILEFVFAGFAAVAAALHMEMAMAETRVLNGTVAYRERMALPPDASVEIALVDVSRMGVPSDVIAKTTIPSEQRVPIPYRLGYDPSRIVPGRSYALQASITVEDRFMFVTATHHPVFAGGADKTDILVERVAGAASPEGRWLVEDIRGGVVVDRLKTVLEIAGDGQISGTGGCNRMSGRATISGDKISFGPMAATSMACAPAVMDQEAKFFATLRDVRAWRVDPVRRKLALLDERGDAVIVLVRM